MFTWLSCERASFSVFTGVTVSQVSLASMQPRLVLQVSKVGEMHVGVTESWQQEMLSLCPVSLPYPESQYRQDGRMRTGSRHCTAALPLACTSGYKQILDS